MHLLLIAAALSNQLWFETEQHASTLVVSPMATLLDDCHCRLTINVVHQGQSGQSNSSQSGEIMIKGKQPLQLASMTLDIPHGEWTQITVTLSDSKGIILQQSWQSSTPV